MEFHITNTLIASPQPDFNTLHSLEQRGIHTVINLRPTSENATHLHQAREIVRSAKGTYHYIPVTFPTLTQADIYAFHQACRQSKTPIFAYCGSGKRVLSLYTLSEILYGSLSEKDIPNLEKKHGIPLSEVRVWLQQHHEKKAHVEGFFEPRTWSVQYIVTDPQTRECAIIDPILDYDEKSGTTATHTADSLLQYITDHNLKLTWILDTHPHADHFSAAQYIKKRTGAPTGIGVHVRDVQELWKGMYNIPSLTTDGSQWDHLFEDGETFTIGTLTGTVLFSPGHTLASVTYHISDAAFVHDTIFMPDSGTARADFPGGNARILWNSIQNILSLPENTRLFTGHDYQPNGRHPRWESSIAEQKATNLHLCNIQEKEFITLRERRDATLPMPKLILHALQVNIRGGNLPHPEENGTRYLKIPLNLLPTHNW